MPCRPRGSCLSGRSSDFFVFRFGLLEQSRRPTARRRRARATRHLAGRACQELRLGLRVRELAHTQRRLHAAGRRFAPDAATSCHGLATLEGVERLDVAAVREQQLRQLQLDFARLPGKSPDAGRQKRARREPPMRRG